MAKVVPVPEAQHLRQPQHNEEALLKRLDDVHFEKERLVEAVKRANRQLQDHIAQSAVQLEREKAKTIDSLKAQLASSFMSAASREQHHPTPEKPLPRALSPWSDNSAAFADKENEFMSQLMDLRMKACRRLARDAVARNVIANAGAQASGRTATLVAATPVPRALRANPAYQ